MAICDIQKQNRVLRGDFLKMIENHLTLLRESIVNPDKTKFFSCVISNDRSVEFHFTEEATKQKCYELEFNTEEDTDQDSQCVCLSDNYSDFDDVLFKINEQRAYKSGLQYAKRRVFTAKDAGDPLPVQDMVDDKKNEH